MLANYDALIDAGMVLCDFCRVENPEGMKGWKIESTYPFKDYSYHLWEKMEQFDNIIKSKICYSPQEKADALIITDVPTEKVDNFKEITPIFNPTDDEEEYKEMLKEFRGRCNSYKICKTWKRKNGTVVHKKSTSEYWGDYIQFIPPFEYDYSRFFGVMQMDGMALRSLFSSDEQTMLKEADEILDEIREYYNMVHNKEMY